jgi:hypothetical protein
MKFYETFLKLLLFWNFMKCFEIFKKFWNFLKILKYEILWIFWNLFSNFGKFFEILENAIGQYSTNSVNGGNKRMIFRSEYVFFQVKTWF